MANGTMLKVAAPGAGAGFALGGRCELAGSATPTPPSAMSKACSAFKARTYAPRILAAGLRRRP